MVPRSEAPTQVAALVAVLIGLLGGCGTIDSQVAYWSEADPEGPDGPGGRSVYVLGGTVGDIKWAGRMIGADRWTNPEIFVLLPFWLMDVPLSLAADVAILPMTIVQQIETLFRGSASPPPATRPPS